MKGKAILFIYITFLFFLCLAFPVYAQQEMTLYFRVDTHTINGIEGYRLAEAIGAGNKYDEISTFGLCSISYGVRIWVVHESGSTEEITDGQPVAVVTRNTDGSGLQNATWHCPGYDGIINALMVKVYQKFGAEDWNLRVTFITENQTLIKLPKSDWTIYYFTKRIYEPDTTVSYFYWGKSYGSRIELQYAEPNPYELMLWNLENGDFISFLLLPYTYYIGNLIYGIFLFALGIIMYNRFEDVSAATLAMLLLIGGGAVGGIIGILIPATGLQLSWVLFVLGIAILLYRLVKGTV